MITIFAVIGVITVLLILWGALVGGDSEMRTAESFLPPKTDSKNILIREKVFREHLYKQLDDMVRDLRKLNTSKSDFNILMDSYLANSLDKDVEMYSEFYDIPEYKVKSTIQYKIDLLRVHY